MASLKADKTISSLLAKGFVQDDMHHHIFKFWHDGKLIAKTHTSHNNQDIYDALISAMRKQCKMDKPFFLEFIKCTKTQEDYLNLLIKQKLIPKK
jgi:hypothetical protein